MTNEANPISFPNEESLVLLKELERARKEGRVKEGPDGCLVIACEARLEYITLECTVNS